MDLVDTLAELLNNQGVSARQTEDDPHVIIVRAHIGIAEPRYYNKGQMVLPFTNEELLNIGAGTKISKEEPHFWYEGVREYEIYRMSQAGYKFVECVPKTLMIQGNNPFESTIFMELASKWKVEERSFGERVVTAHINHPRDGQNKLEIRISPSWLVKPK